MMTRIAPMLLLLLTAVCAVQAQNGVPMQNAENAQKPKADLIFTHGNGITFDKRGLPAPFQYAIQTTNGQTELIWPKSVATTKLVYPRPVWGK